MKDVIKKNYFHIIVFVSAFLLLMFVGKIEYLFQDDTMQYVDMQGYLPPLYPIFLWMLRMVFGIDHYLYMTVVAQSLMGALGITLLIQYVDKKYQCAKWILCVLFVMLFAPYVRESMREVPRYMYSHLILTEALSIPLFYYYVWIAMHVIADKKLTTFGWLNFWAVMLVLSRAQFQVCLILNTIVLVYLVWNQKNKRIVFFIAGLAIVIVSYLSTGVCEDAYKIVRMGTTKSAWNSAYFLLHSIYASDAEDVALYEDEEYRELYTRLYDQLDDIHYNYKYLDGRVYDKSRHWSEGFSRIYRDLKSTISEYVTEQGITDPVEQDEAISHYVDGLMKPLFIKNGLKSFAYSLYQFPISLCSSVFVVKENHLWFSYLGTICIYIIAIFFLVWRFIQKKDSFAVWFMVFNVFFIIGNSIVVGYALHTQSRYLLYSMGTFYLSLTLLCYELWNSHIEKVRNNKGK